MKAIGGGGDVERPFRTVNEEKKVSEVECGAASCAFCFVF